MSSQQTLFIGIDAGTSSIRCLAVDADGLSIATSKISLPAAENPAPGCFEQNPDIWRNSLQLALDRLFEQIEAKNVRGFCVDATSTTVMLCDTELNPVGKALMYNDSRAESQVIDIRKQAPAGHICASPSSSLAKSLWLLNQYAEHSNTFILHQADWLNACLLGHLPASDPNNCLKLGYDCEHLYWPHWLSGFDNDLCRRLPDVLTTGSLLGHVSPALSERYGLATDTCVYAGTTDSTASSLATGIEQIGDAVTTLGTTMTAKIVTDHAIESLDYGVYSHLLPNGLWLTGGASNVGGKVLEKYFTAQQLITLSAEIDTQTDSGLNFYPLAADGERFPINDPLLPARLTPRPENDAIFLQGIFEGFARVEQLAYVTLAELGAGMPMEIITAGGAAAGNQTLSTIREKIIALPVRTATQTEAAYGVANIARQAWNHQR